MKLQCDWFPADHMSLYVLLLPKFLFTCNLQAEVLYFFLSPTFYLGIQCLMIILLINFFQRLCKPTLHQLCASVLLIFSHLVFSFQCALRRISSKNYAISWSAALPHICKYFWPQPVEQRCWLQYLPSWMGKALNRNNACHHINFICHFVFTLW